MVYESPTLGVMRRSRRRPSRDPSRRPSPTRMVAARALVCAPPARLPAARMRFMGDAGARALRALAWGSGLEIPVHLHAGRSQHELAASVQGSSVYAFPRLGRGDVAESVTGSSATDPRTRPLPAGAMTTLSPDSRPSAPNLSSSTGTTRTRPRAWYGGDLPRADRWPTDLGPGAVAAVDPDR